MSEPIYAQRYGAKRRLPHGRAEAAFAGRDQQGRPVVVTVVRPLDPDVFLRTMGVVASVRHLDLAVVVDAGRDGGECFVVAEDPGGPDAATLVAAGPLPVPDAALAAASAAAGLSALHERGVVHGGVDPTSVVRATDDSIVLTGAGLAEAYAPPDLRPRTPPDVARYLSPEEVAGRAPTPASDVYRLGLVAYLLLTGRHAFDGADGAVVAQEQLDGVVRPPQLLNPEVPPALAQVVTRALDKDPEARGTAAQFQADIERVLRSAQVQDVVAERRPSRAWLWILLVVIAALAALAIAWALGAFDSGGDVKVPDVSGMTQKRATAALAGAGLETGKVTQVQSTDGPEGTVVGQDPAAGKMVDEGSSVDLEVAAGPSPSPTATPVAVPDVVGSSQAAAETQLTGAGFIVVVNQSESDTVPAGTVISQDPAAGVVATPGSRVGIVVSTGPPTPSPTASASP